MNFVWRAVLERAPVKNLGTAVMLVQILDLSRGEALDAFTHSATGLKTLGEWVSEASASDEASVALAKHVLALLRKLPIDIEALRISGIAK